MPKERLAAIGLNPFEDTDREVRRRLLDTKDGMPPEVRAVLRTKLGELPETSVPTGATNAPPKQAPSQ
jgi:fructose-bisphosphate aldolase class 1